MGWTSNHSGSNLEGGPTRGGRSIQQRSVVTSTSSLERRRLAVGERGRRMKTGITIIALLVVLALVVSYIADTADDFALLKVRATDFEAILVSFDELSKLVRDDTSREEFLQSLQNIRSAVQSIVAKVQSQTALEDQLRQEIVTSLEKVAADVAMAQAELQIDGIRVNAGLDELKSRLDVLRTKVEAANPIGMPIGSLVIELLSRLAWPLLAVVLLIYLTSESAPQQINKLTQPFTSIGIFGTKFVLSREQSDETKLKVEEAFNLYRNQVKIQFDLWIQKRALNQKFRNILRDTVIPHLRNTSSEKHADYRFTIHVPDLLFADSLYQLLDYYPSSGGRGRTVSVRFGIIGRTWRAGESQWEETVPSDPEILITGWGMTPEEADKASQGQRRAFLSVLLKDNKEGAVGMFYMDSSHPEDVFGQHQFRTLVEDVSQNSGLVDTLTKMKQDLAGRSLLLKLHG